jgi:hypothetical protein
VHSDKATRGYVSSSIPRYLTNHESSNPTLHLSHGAGIATQPADREQTMQGKLNAWDKKWAGARQQQ